jgi:hypothetical protein
LYILPLTDPFCFSFVLEVCRGGSRGSGASRLFTESVQLSTTGMFCPKNGQYSTIKYYISCLPQNPWILDFSDVVLNSTVFSIFSAKHSSST